MDFATLQLDKTDISAADAVVNVSRKVQWCQSSPDAEIDPNMEFS